jgi:hypothetical protein
MKKYKFTIEGTSPLLPHKFNGQDEEKALKQRSDQEQAEAHVYRLPNNHLGVPNEWVKGCLRDYLISVAGSKKKLETKAKVSPRIAVEPTMLDLEQEEYEVDRRAVPSGAKTGGTRDFCVRPKINTPWKTEGILVTSLDKTKQQLEKDLTQAGVEVGMGSNRINGYGRFKVTKFEEIKEETEE